MLAPLASGAASIHTEPAFILVLEVPNDAAWLHFKDLPESSLVASPEALDLVLQTMTPPYLT